MNHTRLIEAHSEETLRNVQHRSGYDALVTQTRAWAEDGGVTMTDDELRGALTALQWVYLRSGPNHYDMPVSICHLIGEAGATFLGMNRTRELTEAEREQIEALFDGLDGGFMRDISAAPETDVMGELVNRARTALANDEIALADTYLSAILRAAEKMGAQS